MNIVHINTRSLLSSFYEFSNFVNSENSDIISLSETWLPTDLPNKFIHIPGYHILRADRPSRGGGVAFYIKEHIKFSKLNTVEVQGIELLAIKIHLKKKSTLAVCLIYRPPSTPYIALNHLDDVFCQLSLEFDSMIVLGDFNVNLLADSNDSKLIKAITRRFDLVQLITEPTRITNTSISLIDHIYVSTKLSVIKTFTKPTLFSDHMLVGCELNTAVCKPKPLYLQYRNFALFNYENFTKDCENIVWKFPVEPGDTNEKLDFLNNIITSIFDVHAPICKKIIRGAPKPYITDNIRLMIKLKNKALTRFKKLRTPGAKQYYLDLKKLIGEAIAREKTAYFSYVFSAYKSDPKKLWTIIKRLNPSSNKQKPNIPDSLNNPNLINNYLLNNITTIDVVEDFAANVGNPYVTDKLCFHPVTNIDLNKILNSIKTNATGVDGINIRMLHLVSPFCIDMLTNIVNESLTTGVVPNLWKFALITPLPKKETIDSMSEIRPISILPTSSKLLEKVVAHQLLEHLTSIKSLPPLQSDFRKRYGTHSLI